MFGRMKKQDYGWHPAGARQHHGDGPRHDRGQGRPREREIAEDQECRDREIAEERKRSDAKREESEHRIAAINRQMERLQQMFAEQSVTAATARGWSTAEIVKLTRLTDSNDIESYLTTFERVMAAN